MTSLWEGIICTLKNRASALIEIAGTLGMWS